MPQTRTARILIVAAVVFGIAISEISMAWAFKKARSLGVDGQRALVVAAVAAVCLLLLLATADTCLARPKLDPNKLKSLGVFLGEKFEIYLADRRAFASFVTRLEPHVSRASVLDGSFFVAAAAVFVAIAQGTKAVARKLVEICARTYRGLTNALLRAYFFKAISVNVNLLAILFLLSLVYSYFYNDDSGFLLVGYLGFILLFASFVSLFELRTGRFFEDEASASDLLHYLRNGMDGDTRQMLIEMQVSEAEEFRAG
ncbi:MAG: hypothetical protein JOY77_07630 [Alphaproteobacteria bacterium]|nr:hypothetical protein [Alphaproteobacteria bacterium]